MTETKLKASELRINNWVYVIKIYPVQITADHIKSISEGDTDYKPIELTPEILEKAGFKLGEKGFWFSNGIEYNPTEHILEGFGHCEIKHLHQLQNLYFALTGTELEINL